MDEDFNTIHTHMGHHGPNNQIIIKLRHGKRLAGIPGTVTTVKFSTSVVIAPQRPVGACGSTCQHGSPLVSTAPARVTMGHHGSARVSTGKHGPAYVSTVQTRADTGQHVSTTIMRSTTIMIACESE